MVDSIQINTTQTKSFNGNYFYVFVFICNFVELYHLYTYIVMDLFLQYKISKLWLIYVFVRVISSLSKHSRKIRWKKKLHIQKIGNKFWKVHKLCILPPHFIFKLCAGMADRYYTSQCIALAGPYFSGVDSRGTKV